MKRPIAVSAILLVQCALALAQAQSDVATPPQKRKKIPESVAAELLCGSSTAPSTTQNGQMEQRESEESRLCGPFVPPSYPAEAQQQRIQGSVYLDGVISTTGEIRELRVIRGHPLLVPAAVEAVKRWRYRPYYVRGTPVEVETAITVNFKLSKPKKQAP